jgi:hypothetical protein
MKQTLWLLLILILLGAATGWFLTHKSDSTLQKEMRDFAVKDTAAITKIFLVNRNGNSVTLERRSPGTWVLNHNEVPKYDLLAILLDCIYRVEVRSPVAKAAYNNVISTLAASAIKCEIYMNGDSIPAKVYYVGSQTEDDLGTFMMLEKSSQPFITHIPGFNGYLTPRYSVRTEDWKSTALFTYSPVDIKSVMINYANAPEKSFVLYEENERYYVVNPNTNTFIKQIDTTAIQNYLMQYKSIFYETLIKSPQRDTLPLTQATVRISIKDSNGKLKELQVFPMPLSPTSLGQTDEQGRTLKYDLDRVYGLVTPENILVTIQQPILNRLLRQMSDFDINRSETKKPR